MPPLFNANDLRSEVQRDLGQRYPINPAEEIRSIIIESENYPVDATFDIFMSYRGVDAVIVLGLVKKIRKLGYSVCIDSEIDPQLDRANTSADTAETLKNRMNHCQCLFYATTTHYQESKWMPWELGYFDGHSGAKVAILPVSELSQPVYEYKGTEYLGLYYYVTFTTHEGKGYIWIQKEPCIFTDLRSWLQGKQPSPQ